MIKLQVIGHLGRDCVQNEVNGKQVINFNVAHSEQFKDSQGVQVERTTWVNCAYWTDRTGIAPYLVKGKLVYVEGTPDVETYTNKEGQTAANLRLRVFSVQLLGGKMDSSQEGSSSQAGAQTSSSSSSRGTEMAAASQTEPADDLPF